MSLSHLVFGAECGIRLCRFLIIASLPTLYVNNLVGDIYANPRDLYTVDARIVRKRTFNVSHHLKRTRIGVTQSELEQVEFSDVFNKKEHNQVPLLSGLAPFMNDIVVSTGLNHPKVLGPDVIA